MSDVFDKCSTWKDYRSRRPRGCTRTSAPSRRRTGHRGRDRGPPGHHGRLEQLPRAGRRPAGEGSGDRGGGEVRHHLLRLAPAQRHPRRCTRSSRRGWRSSSTARPRWSSPPASRPTWPRVRPSSAATTSSSATGRTTPRWWTASGSASPTEKQVPPQRHGAPRAAARGGRPRAPGRSSSPTACSRWRATSATCPEIVELAKKYKARVMTDDAHSMGVLGEQRPRHRPSTSGSRRRPTWSMGTFSKSFASPGRRASPGPFDVINYIKHKARSVIFSRLHDAGRRSPRRSRRWRSSRPSRSAARACWTSPRRCTTASAPWASTRASR